MQELLERFAIAALTDGGVLAVNGLRKGATPRQLMHRAAAIICDLSFADVTYRDSDPLSTLPLGLITTHNHSILEYDANPEP